MGAREDAAARRLAWEAAGAPDYNNGGAPAAPLGSESNPYQAGTTYATGPAAGTSRTTQAAPYAPVVAAPTVTQASGRNTYSDGGQTYFGPAAPSAAPAAPAAPNAGKTLRTNPVTGVTEEISDEDYQNLLDRAAEQTRQTGVAETQAQFQLDTARAAQVANEAYNNAMLQYNNAQLAQAAADNAMRNDIAQQQAETARAGQVNQSSYQQGLLANQNAAQASDVQFKQQTIAAQGIATQQDRRKRRPYRPLRVTNS